MALTKSSSAMIMILFMAMSTLCGISMSAEHEIDFDSSGWIIMDDDDYEIPVNLGDSIIFHYENTNHDLTEVTLEDYNSCNAASPIAKYNSGNDNITFERPENYYFICGFPNHCQNGEKVTVKIVQNPEPPIMAPKLSDSGNSPSTASSGRKIAPKNKPKGLL
ncbi:hypothetical protein ACOSQ2_001535 [Xanthoceras sorbifolium]